MPDAKKLPRSQSRETAFIYYFEKLFHPEATYVELRELAEEVDLPFGDGFTETLFTQTVESSERTDEIIRRYLKKWRLERLPKTVLAILRLSVAEIMCTKDVPPAVIANEAVELAKKYASPQDASFINGLLGSFIRERPDLQAASEPVPDGAGNAETEE